MSFGEGEGVGVHCCDGWFVIGDIRGTHLCWVCVSGVVRKSYGSTSSVRVIQIKLIYMLILHIGIKLIRMRLANQVDPYKGYGST